MDSVPISTTTSSSTSSVDAGRGGGSASGSEFLSLGMFGSGSTSGGGGTAGQQDLFGSFGGGAFGNGYGNSEAGGLGGGTTGAASTGGAPGSSTAFDLNDFPSLGGGAPGSAIGGGSPANNGLSAALRQQQLSMAHQQMLQSGKGGSASSNLYRLAMQSGNGGNFNMATEDFPALPGAPVGGGSGGSNGALSGPANSSLLLSPGGNIGSSLTGTAVGNAFATGQRTGGFYSEDLDSGGGGNVQLDGSGLLGGLAGGLQTAASNNPGHQSTSGGSTGGSSSAAGAGSALSGDYGLLGLLSVIRMTDADRNALALGTDLTVLGLNLNSNDNLYSNFSGPWTETPATNEPHYQLPMCYYMQPPALKTGHLSKFQLETLFYIFYALAKDVLQAYAAQELYSREWRYHAELKRWFKRATPSDGLAAPNSSAPQFLYFDINSWERRLFTGNMNQNITSGFMTEDEVRVKFPNS